jgi:GAF domain-containing protein
MARITDESVVAEADFQALGDHLVERLSSVMAFQRFNIGLIDPDRYIFTDAYVSGLNVAGRVTGHERTLDGTVVERAIRAGDGAFFGGDAETLLKDFPRFGPVLESGMRSMMAVPLRGQGRVIAALVLASDREDGFDLAKLKIVQDLGAEIVDRIAALINERNES